MFRGAPFYLNRMCFADMNDMSLDQIFYSQAMPHSLKEKYYQAWGYATLKVEIQVHQRRVAKLEKYKRREGTQFRSPA